jgi:hypothetical protein
MSDQQRPPRPQRKLKPATPGNAITPFNRTGKLPPLPAETPAPQADPFAVRLDPSGKPGEFNFVIESPTLVSRVPQADGLEAEASGTIPPVLYKAVDEVLGFIYALDQQFENPGRKPKK